MEALQAKRLLCVVNRTRGEYLIPDGAELAKMFSSKGKRMTPRGARAVIERLAKHGCIRGENRKRFLDDRRVVTQMSSCLYLLFFHEACLGHNRTIPKRSFHRQVNRKLGTKFRKLGGSIEKMYSYAVGANYIREVETEPGMLEIGSALTFFLPYLQLFRNNSKS
jgi:hypothetical protein